MTDYETQRLGSTVVAEAASGPVTVAEQRHHSLRVIAEDDGSESYEPVTETEYLLRVGEEERSLRLTPWERRRVLEALQEVGDGAPTEKIDKGRAVRSPTVEDRIWVHREVEWLVSRGSMPDPEEFESDAIGSLRSMGAGAPDGVVRLSLLVGEVRRALGRCERSERFAEMCGPVDPEGELEGPRPGVTRLVCRGREKKEMHPPPEGRSSDQSVVVFVGIAPPAAAPAVGPCRLCVVARLVPCVVGPVQPARCCCGGRGRRLC